jgi:hypothetical protein
MPHDMSDQPVLLHFTYMKAISPSRLRKYRPILLSHELDQNFQRWIFHGLEYGPVNFGFRTCL